MSKGRLGYGFLLICYLFTSSCLAVDMSTRLTQILTQIKNVKQLLSRHQSQQSCLQKELQRTEIAINHILQNLRTISQSLEEKRTKIQILNDQQQQINAKIKKQQTLLLQQIRAAYLLGLNKNNLQYLLQGNDCTQVNRLLTYNRYLNAQSMHLIAALKNDLAVLEKNKSVLQTNISYLAELKATQALQQQGLSDNKKNQEAVLQNLSKQLKTQSEQLAELQKNKKNLESVIQQVQKKENYTSEFLTFHRGKFPWPTSGRIKEQFGSNIQNSELKQNGVLISAPEGQKVYAVAPGRVIFANWMPGYGLLLIVDHGKGYMTLYGNNGVLYKKLHDLVGNHELIATVGHTGGQQKSALYFALRYQGKPINPSTWCG